MSGTPAGGKKASISNKQRHGEDFYSVIGSKGGKISRGGGFASNRELASKAGYKGGKVTKAEREKRKKKEYWLKELLRSK